MPQDTVVNLIPEDVLPGQLDFEGNTVEEKLESIPAPRHFKTKEKKAAPVNTLESKTKAELIATINEWERANSELLVKLADVEEQLRYANQIQTDMRKALLETREKNNELHKAVTVMLSTAQYLLNE